MKKSMVILAVLVAFGVGVFIGKGVISDKIESYKQEMFERTLIEEFESRGHEVCGYEFVNRDDFTVYYKNCKDNNYRVFEYHDGNYSDAADKRGDLERLTNMMMLRVQKGE